MARKGKDDDKSTERIKAKADKVDKDDKDVDKAGKGKSSHDPLMEKFAGWRKDVGKNDGSEK